jgi:hypothetical protein
LFGFAGIVAALKQFHARIKWIYFLHSFLHLGQEPIWMIGGPISFRLWRLGKEKLVLVSG